MMAATNAGSSEVSRNGFGHPDYARAFAADVPRHLARSGGWLLERQIPGSALRDAVGCYPLFVCRNWSGLAADLAEAGSDLVSVTLVPDPFAAMGQSELRQIFDHVAPFKDHYITDLSTSAGSFVSNHHQKVARRAVRRFRTAACDQPTEWLDEWMRLYDHLWHRHRLDPAAAFSRATFERQMRVPGFTMFGATLGESVAGLHMWYVDEDVAYSYAAATSPEGYRSGAAYALHWFAIEWFSSRVRFLHLGGSAGLGDRADGLAWFKRGWATETARSYLCGRVLDVSAYQRLALERSRLGDRFFPAYRG